MKNKYGTYIQKLMTVVLDKEQDEFVQKLAWNELNSLGENVKEFLIKNELDSDLKEKEKIEKILLQEKIKQENKHGKNT